MQRPKLEGWMIQCAYSLTQMLPDDPEEAHTVLAITSGIVEDVKKRYFSEQRKKQ